MDENNPYINIGPGDIIKDELEARDWTQQDLADITGLPAQMVNMVIEDEYPITSNFAILLAKAFETSTELWVNLYNNYNKRRFYENI